jgi:hypothetical protein
MSRVNPSDPERGSRQAQFQSPEFPGQKWLLTTRLLADSGPLVCLTEQISGAFRLNERTSCRVP